MSGFSAFAEDFGARDSPEAQCIYLAGLHASEKRIGENLRLLMKGNPPRGHIAPDAALPWAEKKLGLTLAPSQKDAVAEALKSKVLVITGGPGVGKTTIVKAILLILKATQSPAVTVHTTRPEP